MNINTPQGLSPRFNCSYSQTENRRSTPLATAARRNGPQSYGKPKCDLFETQCSFCNYCCTMKQRNSSVTMYPSLKLYYKEMLFMPPLLCFLLHRIPTEETSKFKIHLNTTKLNRNTYHCNHINYGSLSVLNKLPVASVRKLSK